MESIPVSKICPSCGSDQFRKVRSKRRISFSDDRICLKCKTRFAPPTPRWAGILFVVFGAIVFITGSLLTVLSLLDIPNYSKPSGPTSNPLVVMALAIPMIVIGGASVAHGIRAISKAGAV
jgi:hypothetical protein